MTALVVASYVAVIGFSTVPFALADATTGALIAGCFALANTILNGLVLRQARRNADLTRGVGEGLNVIHSTAREGVQELVDVKRKVEGERRQGGDRRHREDDRRER